MKLLIGTFFLFVMMMTANASIIYDINRTIGDGSVNGFIETDGTLGLLSQSNITNLSLTLTSNNLTSPSPITLDFATSNIIFSGTSLSATLSDLFFNFDVYGYIYVQLHDSVDWHVPYWGLSTNDYYVNQATGSLSGELLGWGAGNTAAEAVAYSGSLGIAISDTSGDNGGTIPEPTTLALMGLGLAGIGYRRKVK